MSKYLRSIDVNQHLMSTSFTHGDILSPVQGLTGIDFTMSHYYGFNDTVDNVTKYVCIPVVLIVCNVTSYVCLV